MRVLIVSQYYPPEAVPLPSDLAQGLSLRGHRVRVLTGYPNYPSGRIFPGYRQRWRTTERDDAVEVNRVPLFADHSQSAIRRMLNYGSFALSAATARRLSRGADVVYVYATQMTAALGPWIWRRTGGPPYVLHIQDLWPDSVSGSSMVNGKRERAVARLLTPWLRNVYRGAAGVIGIAPTMVSTLVSRGIPRDRAHLVYNWADRIDPVESIGGAGRDPSLTGVLYAGNVGDMQDLGTAIRAAHAARDAGVVLTLVGDGVACDSLRSLAEELGADNVRFESPVPRDRMPEVYARADFALVPLRDLPAFHGTMPSKFPAALAAGIPVVATVQGDVRRIVDGSGIGVTADAESVPSLEAAFRTAAALGSDARKTMGRRARVFYDTHFSRESGIAKIEGLLFAAAKGTRRAR